MLLEILVAPVILVISFFSRHDCGPKEPKKALRSTILFGILAVILVLIIDYLLESVFKVTSSPIELVGIPGTAFITSVIIFAAVEELAKFLPLALWIRKKPFFEEVTDGVIYFAYVGFAFGTIENFMYAASYGTSVGIMRIVMLLYFHGALTAIVGYFFARGYIHKKSWRDGILALIGASLLHAAYNYCMFNYLDSNLSMAVALTISAILNSLMFWLFYKAQITDYKSIYSANQQANVVMQAPPSTMPIAANPVVISPSVANLNDNPNSSYDNTT